MKAKLNDESFLSSKLLSCYNETIAFYGRKNVYNFETMRSVLIDSDLNDSEWDCVFVVLNQESLGLTVSLTAKELVAITKLVEYVKCLDEVARCNIDGL